MKDIKAVNQRRKKKTAAIFFIISGSALALQGAYYTAHPVFFL